MQQRRLGGRQKRMGKLDGELLETIKSQPCCNVSSKQNFQNRGNNFCMGERTRQKQGIDQNEDHTYLEKLKEEAEIMARNLAEIESKIKELVNRSEAAL